ncbi:MAG: SDR family NAD(P)-dependent oxidoreductase [Bacteroidota bacterium]
MKDKRIFVTGGTGFLGSYLLRYLVQRGYRNVLALRRPNSSSQLVGPIREQVQWIEGDILDVGFLEEVLLEVDLVYHCAGMVSYHPRHTERMIEINEMGTANVVNVLLHHGKGRLLHVSSIAAIGRSKENRHISESSKWVRSPLTSYYAISKFLAEQQVWRGIAEGLDAVIINPSIIIGSGFWERGSARFFPRIEKGQRFYPLGSSGFVDVRDVARLAIELMESDISAERFIANGANLSYKKFFQIIAQSLGVAPPRTAAGPWLSGIAWRVEALRSWLTGSKPFLTKQNALLAGVHFTYDNQKSVDTLGFKYFPIEEALSATAEQYRQSSSERILPLL